MNVLPTPEAKAAQVESMFDRIAPRYDRLNRLLTFGLDQGWRRRAVRDLALAPGGVVLDIACGTGDFCIELERRGLVAVGIDVSAGMLAHARWKDRLVRTDALVLPVPDGSVAGMTCGFALRNFTALEPFFAEAARAVRPGGRIAFLDVGEPKSRIVKAGHTLYFRKIVPFVGGLLSDKAAYRYLPESTAYLPERERLVAMVRDAGFDHVVHRSLGLGASQLITGTRR